MDELKLLKLNLFLGGSSLSTVCVGAYHPHVPIQGEQMWWWILHGSTDYHYPVQDLFSQMDLTKIAGASLGLVGDEAP